MTPIRIAKAIAAIGIALAASVALAHDDATLDKMKTPHGGQLRAAGVYHFELVVARDARPASERPVVVYLTDHAGQKVPAAGAKGTATLLGAAGKASITLAPDGDNRLKGVGKYASDPTLKAVVVVTFANGSSEQARFEPMKAMH